MASKVEQVEISADIIQTELELDAGAILASAVGPKAESDSDGKTRFDYLELEKQGFDKAAIQAMALAGLVKDEGIVVEDNPPWWLKPETAQDVENILRIVGAYETEKDDLVKQHQRKLKKQTARLKFYEEAVLPQCVLIVDGLLPRDKEGNPKQKFVEGELKRLQLRTQGEKITLRDANAVILNMEAMERELSVLEEERDLLHTVDEITPEQEERVGEILKRTTTIEADLDALTKAFRLTIITKEEHLGEAGWKLLGEYPQPEEGETYEKTVVADLVEAFVRNHAPLPVIDEQGEVLEERPYELLGVVRADPKTTIYAG